MTVSRRLALKTGQQRGCRVRYGRRASALNLVVPNTHTLFNRFILPCLFPAQARCAQRAGIFILAVHTLLFIYICASTETPGVLDVAQIASLVQFRGLQDVAQNRGEGQTALNIDFIWGSSWFTNHVKAAAHGVPRARVLRPTNPAHKALLTGKILSNVNIAIVTFEFEGMGSVGGVGTAYTELSRVLADAGANITVLFYHWSTTPSSQAFKMLQPGVHVEYVRLVHVVKVLNRRLWVVSASLHVCWRLMASARRHTAPFFDVVHFPDNTGVAFYSVEAQRAGALPHDMRLVVTLHGSTAWASDLSMRWPEPGWEAEVSRVLEASATQHAPFVTSPSLYMVRYLSARGQRFNDQPVVIPNPAPPTIDSKMESCAEEVVGELVFFGRLEARKGLFLFLDALDILFSPRRSDDTNGTVLPERGLLPRYNIKITFLGPEVTLGRHHRSTTVIRERHMKSGWHNLSISLRIRDRRTAALEYLKQTIRVTTRGASVCVRKLAVMPSLSENAPYTVVEAASLGIPFLAASTGGIPELIDPRDHSLALFLPTANDLATALKNVLGRRVRGHHIRMRHTSLQTAAMWVSYHRDILSSDTNDQKTKLSPPISTATFARVLTKPTRVVVLISPGMEFAADSSETGIPDILTTLASLDQQWSAGILIHRVLVLVPPTHIARFSSRLTASSRHLRFGSRVEVVDWSGQTAQSLLEKLSGCSHIVLLKAPILLTPFALHRLIQVQMKTNASAVLPLLGSLPQNALLNHDTRQTFELAERSGRGNLFNAMTYPDLTALPSTLPGCWISLRQCRIVKTYRGNEHLKPDLTDHCTLRSESCGGNGTWSLLPARVAGRSRLDCERLNGIVLGKGNVEIVTRWVGRRGLRRGTVIRHVRQGHTFRTGRNTRTNYNFDWTVHAHVGPASASLALSQPKVLGPSEIFLASTASWSAHVQDLQSILHPGLANASPLDLPTLYSALSRPHNHLFTEGGGATLLPEVVGFVPSRLSPARENQENKHTGSYPRDLLAIAPHLAELANLDPAYAYHVLRWRAGIPNPSAPRQNRLGLVADSENEYSHVQGMKGWRFEFLNKTIRGSSSSMRPMNLVACTDSSGLWSANCPKPSRPTQHLSPCAYIGRRVMHPCITHAVATIPVRIYVSALEGLFRLQFRTAYRGQCGDGVRVDVSVTSPINNGTTKQRLSSNFTDTLSTSVFLSNPKREYLRETEIEIWMHVGTTIAVLVDPLENDRCDTVDVDIRILEPFNN